MRAAAADAGDVHVLARPLTQSSPGLAQARSTNTTTAALDARTIARACPRRRPRSVPGLRALCDRACMQRRRRRQSPPPGYAGNIAHA
jgi:hypothetical protein